MLRDRRCLLVSLTANALAFILLIVMIALPWPFDFAFPGISVLSGDTVLPAKEFAIYLQAMQMNYAVDEIFIICWIIGWSALCMQIGGHLKFILLLLGLAGPTLDFTENSYIWQMISMLERGQSANAQLMASWRAIQHLSYIIPFSVSFLLLCGLYIQQTVGIALLLAGGLATAIAIFGLYLPALEIATYLWWLLFFLTASYISWVELRVNTNQQ
jgi:hypothetical protein